MIKIYTTPTCIYCKMAKEFFQKRGVQYEEYNVVEDEKARNEMFEKSHQMGVPVIEINDEIFVGFDRAGLERAIEKMKK